MIELKVTVDAPELSAAINHLAEAIESKALTSPPLRQKTPAARKLLPKLPRTHLRLLLLPRLSLSLPRPPLNSRLWPCLSPHPCRPPSLPRHSSLLLPPP
jgi:hypothetical protein